MSDRRSLLIAALPAALLLASAPFAAAGARGLFQAQSAGLAVMVVVYAFALPLQGKRIPLLPLSAALAALAALLIGGAAGGILPSFVLLLGVGTAAAGLARLGRALGARRASAGVVASCMLVVAMLGLFWADPVGDRLPLEKRFAFKQAVMHLDAATACAYDAADFDRFHDELVYARVKLASGAVSAPAALPTGFCWLVFGVLCGVAGLLLERRAAPESGAEPAA